MKRVVLVPLSVILTLSVIAGAIGQTMAAPPGPARGNGQAAAIATSAYCADAEEFAFLGLINAHRALNQRGPLVMSQTVGAAADHHSIDMATQNYFDHVSLGGSTYTQRMVNHGYPATTTARGENIAAGTNSATAQAIFNQWVISPTHNANMLNPAFNVIGIGRAFNQSSQYDWYWTTDFGGLVDGPAKICSGPSPSPSPVGTAYQIVGSGRTANSNASTRAYDGNTASSWYTISSSTPSRAWVYFDVGATRHIGSIQWRFSRACCADVIRVQISTNKTSWSTIATWANPPAGTWQTLPTNVNARYVRLEFLNPNGDAVIGYLAEIRITS